MRFVGSVYCSRNRKTDKNAEMSKLSATVHMNSSRCTLDECAAGGKKKKKKVKKRKCKRKSWIQTQPCICLPTSNINPLCGTASSACTRIKAAHSVRD